MEKAEILNRIARALMVDPRVESPEGHAAELGWIGADGTITAAGSDIVDALMDQNKARSVFRLY